MTSESAVFMGMELTKQTEGGAGPVYIDINVIGIGEGAVEVEPVRVHEPVQRAGGLDVVPALYGADLPQSSW